MTQNLPQVWLLPVRSELLLLVVGNIADNFGMALHQKALWLTDLVVIVNCQL